MKYVSNVLSSLHPLHEAVAFIGKRLSDYLLDQNDCLGNFPKITNRSRLTVTGKPLTKLKKRILII